MIEFDPAKEAASPHGLPFAFAAEIFEGYYVEEVDDRFDYGETRIIAIGWGSVARSGRIGGLHMARSKAAHHQFPESK